MAKAARAKRAARKAKEETGTQSAAIVGFEAKLWAAAEAAIEKDNLRLKGELPKDYARPGLDKQGPGELIDLVGTIGLGDEALQNAAVQTVLMQAEALCKDWVA